MNLVMDTEFKVKWRFLSEKPQDTRPALGIAPKVFFPTADEKRGLGDGILRLQIPLQFGKTVGRWYYFGEGGYQWVFDDKVSNVVFGGLGAFAAFTNHLAMGTELFGGVPTNSRTDWQILTTLGIIVTFNMHWQIKTSLSHTLRSTERGGPNPAEIFYLVWNS